MNRSLFVPVLVLGLTVFFAVALVDSVGLTMFNVLLGNKVYAVTVSYQPSPIYVQGQTTLKYDFKFDLVKLKIPIETIQTRFQIEEQNTIRPVEVGDHFVLSLPVLIYVGDVQPWNRKTLFQHTFTFNDGQARVITIFLLNLNAEYFSKVFVEINGSYNLNDVNVAVEAGATLNIE